MGEYFFSNLTPVKNRFFVFFLLFVLSFQGAFAFLAPEASNEAFWRDRYFDYRTEDSTGTKSDVSLWKFSLVASTTLLAYGASYWLIFDKGWWDEGKTDFHFENDFYYAKNLDKLGHFASGVMMGELFYEGFYWSGLNEFYSYLAAGSSAFLTHVAIDIKDGYSPDWGFSVFDVVFGTLGGFYPMAKRYVPAFKYFDLKWSYWINTKVYYRSSDTGIFTDDYVNQTFWLSLKIYRMLPVKARKYYPEWLALALGLSIDEGRYVYGPDGKLKKGHYEIYLAFDYDLEAFRPRARWARTLIKTLNYFKLPAPTLQLYPDVGIHWIYPIKF